MERTAPHLTRALPWLMPLTAERVDRSGRDGTSAGFRTGDLLRLAARTPRHAAPAAPGVAHRGPRARTRLRPEGLRGGPGLLGRPARGRRPTRHLPGPHRSVVRRARAYARPGDRGDRRRGRRSRDELHRRDAHRGRARARRQRGRGLGGRARRRRSGCGRAGAPTWCCARTPARPAVRPHRCPCRAAAAATSSRCPSRTGTIYVGLTDEPVEGDIPDVPEPTEGEIGFLLDVVGAALRRPLRRDGRDRCVRRTAPAAGGTRAPPPTCRASTPC